MVEHRPFGAIDDQEITSEGGVYSSFDARVLETWEWDTQETAAAAALVGPDIIDGLARSLFVSSEAVEDKLIIGLQSSGLDIRMEFDAAKAIDYVLDDTDQTACSDLLVWLERQTDKVRARLQERQT